MKIVKILVAVLSAFVAGTYINTWRTNKHFMPQIASQQAEIDRLLDEKLNLEASYRKRNVALELARVRSKAWARAARKLDRGIPAYEIQQEFDELSEFTKLIPRML